MTYVLVLYIYAGMLAKGDSVAMLSIDGFTTRQACEMAGKSAPTLVSGSTKEYRFVCLEKK